MSAFIVGHDHIDALLNWAVDHRVSFWDPARQTRIDINRATATDVGRILLYENELSVRHRYPIAADAGGDDLPGMTGETGENYRFRSRCLTLKPVDILKAINCLDYQSCEHDGWEASLAHRICETIAASAIRALPGYEGAQWEITLPERDSMVRLTDLI